MMRRKGWEKHHSQNPKQNPHDTNMLPFEITLRGFERILFVRDLGFGHIRQTRFPLILRLSISMRLMTRLQ